MFDILRYNQNPNNLGNKNMDSVKQRINDALGEVKGLNDPDKLMLIDKYLDHVISFKNDICANSDLIDSDEEQDWTSLSIGFFIARGVLGNTNGHDDDFELYGQYADAHMLATICRYTYQYWC